MKSTITFGVIFFLASVIGCSKKEQTEPPKTEQPPAPKTEQPVAAEAHHPDADMGSMSGQKMVENLGPADKDYEDRFIDMMIPHHQSAIIMAKDALKKTSHPELKKLAQNIIAAQEKEISLMKELRKKWYGHSADDESSSSDQKIGEKLGPAGKDYEDNFIDMMIPHHQTAILMAKDALKKTSHPELKKLAQNIITDQEAEISVMEVLRKKWYGH